MRRAAAPVLGLVAVLGTLAAAWGAGHRVSPSQALRYDSEQVHLAEQIYSGVHRQRFGGAAALRRLVAIELAPGTRAQVYAGGPGQLCYTVRAGELWRTYLVSFGVRAQVPASCPAAGARGGRWRAAGTLSGPPAPAARRAASTLPR